MRVWVIGSLCTDIAYRVKSIPQVGQAKRARLLGERAGGTGLNVSLGIASAGVDVSLIGYVGADGQHLLRQLEDAGVNTDWVQTFDAPTRKAMIFIDDQAQRTMFTLNDDHLHLVHLPIEQVSDDDLVLSTHHYPFFTQQLNELSRKARVITPPHPEVNSSLILYSVEDFPDFDPRSTDAPVVATSGSGGVSLHQGGDTQHFAARQVEAVDTTGAGDTFAAALASQLAQGAKIEQAIQCGINWAAQAVQTEISTPPPFDASLLANEKKN